MEGYFSRFFQLIDFDIHCFDMSDIYDFGNMF